MSTAVFPAASPLGFNERGGSGRTSSMDDHRPNSRAAADAGSAFTSTTDHLLPEDEEEESHSDSGDARGSAVREEQITEDDHYIFLRADTATLVDLFKFLLLGTNVAGKVIQTGNNAPHYRPGTTSLDTDTRWVLYFSAVLRWIILFFKRQMDWFGWVSDFFLNGGTLRGFARNLLTGNRVAPDRNLETYRSVVGHADARYLLHKSRTKSASKQIDEYIIARPLHTDNQALMDLCVMSSKVAYENAGVVQDIVNKQWKMHFVKFYNFWNEFRKERSTQAFIMSDKKLDADIILISFRGARAFNVDDLNIAFDYSWYHVPGMGKVHVGYLEALGLGTRDQISTIRSSLQGTNVQEQETAYFTLTSMLRSLLAEHPRAKFVVTGHGTGGALAALFPAILLFNEERELLKRCSIVYTFGQPKIGDEQLGQFMHEYKDKYFRVVYGNDIMPRLPYDDDVFFYRHFGQGLYYDSLYSEKIVNNVKEEPNRYFCASIIWEFVNAVWEFVRGLAMQYMYGPEYKETWFLFIFRTLALVEPAASAHWITNYINCARLRRQSYILSSSLASMP